MAGEDGSIRIGVKIDDSAATKSLKQLANQAEKLGKSINTNENKHNSLSTQLEDIRTQLSETYAEMDTYQEKIARFEELSKTGTSTTDETAEFLDLSTEVGEASKLLKEKTKEAEKLEQQEAKVKAQDDQILQTLQQQKAELEQQQGLIGEKMAADAEKGSQAVSKLKTETEKSGKAATSASPNFKKLFSNILKYGLGIRSVYILVRKLKEVVTESFTEMAKSDAETQENLLSFKSALAELKGSFGAAFAPILNAVIPILSTLIGWLNKGINAVQTFIAVLSGKTSIKKAVANTQKIANSLSSASGSASELKKQLMGIDELNILSENSGGGSSGADYSYIDEEIDDDSWAAKFAERINQIKLKWAEFLEWFSQKKTERGNYDNDVTWFLRDVLGLPTDQEILAWLKEFIWTKGILAFLEELLTLVTGHDYTGLTGKELVAQLKEGLSGTGDALKEWWTDKVTPWFTLDKWKELGRNAIDGIKKGLTSLGIPQFHLSWDWAEWSGTFFGKAVNVKIPSPNLQFYARGGIVDSATLFGGSSVVGEDGQEAIVPLERHTEWISMVAEGLLDDIMSSNRLAQLAQSFSDIALPAMATGSIVPPGIQSIDDDLKEILSTLNRVIEVLSSMGGSGSSGGEYRFYLDGKEISSVVTKYQRQNARATGV